MSGFSSFFQELFVLYALIGIGAAAKKASILSSHADQALTQLVLYITLPALILYSMDFPLTLALIGQLAWLLALSCFALGTATVLARMWVQWFPSPLERRGVTQGLIVFANQGFLGYAICYALLAETGIAYATLFNLPYLILIWTYGVYLVARVKPSFSWRTIVLNPGVFATLVGVFLLVIPMSWPTSVNHLLSTLGTTTVPLSMVLLGSLLGNLKFAHLSSLLRNPQLWGVATLRLLVLPLLLFLFLPFGLDPSVLLVAVLITGMPSAPTTSLFAQKYGADATWGSVGVLISTFFAFITIPLLYWLLTLFITT
ncbi:AEC family transporter [Ammoniphilus sp. YIM 78166]|uniref:AEC family transporter n=1 Tax=Ammoniphilus sp. YIM 78166 TaxID=1644106 RepID=UPI00143194F2|nr:AEC family transporter [Ammoniphilus sp. YIM 78166]